MEQFLAPPGELLRRSIAAKPVDITPQAYDVILYIVGMLKALNRKPGTKLSVNNGAFYVGCLGEGDELIVYAEDAESNTIFFAAPRDKSWKISVFEPGRWVEILEFAYDKARFRQTTIEDWISEFPPIGVVIDGK